MYEDMDRDAVVTNGSCIHFKNKKGKVLQGCVIADRDMGEYSILVNKTMNRNSLTR